MENKKILFIWNYFYLESEKGDSRFSYLARLLVNKGYDLEIITSNFYHMKKVFRDIKEEELSSLPYKVTFVKELGYKKNISFRRIISINKFNKSVKQYLKSLEYKPDLVYVPVPSIKLASLVNKYCKKNNIPFVIDVEDLWPESFNMVTHNALLTKILFFPLFINANKVYRSADGIIAVSKTFLNRVLSVRKDNPISDVVYIGSDFSHASNIKKVNSKPKNEKWITYIGTIAKSYNLKLFIDAFEILKREGHNEYVLNILGDGPDKEMIYEYAINKQINVRFTGLLPYKEMIEILKDSDYGINPINKRSVATIINKVGDYASVGLPVINTQRCNEYIEILKNSNTGISILSEDAKDIANTILNIDKLNLVRSPLQIFSREVEYQKNIDVISKLTK